MASTRILVAVSSPWAGQRLYGPIRDLVDRLGASLVLAHVARVTDQDQSDDEPRIRGHQALASLIAPLTEEGIPYESVLLFGTDVARAIVNSAEAHKASLIVVGQSAKGAVARFLGGDIPQQLAKISTIPVLVLPAEWTATV